MTAIGSWSDRPDGSSEWRVPTAAPHQCYGPPDTPCECAERAEHELCTCDESTAAPGLSVQSSTDPDCPVHGEPPAYTLESLTADLAQAKAESATDLSAAELTHLTTAATQDAASRYPGDESYAARFTQEVLADLAATPVGEVAATERWRRRQALARGDSLSAYWPEVAG